MNTTTFSTKGYINFGSSAAEPKDSNKETEIPENLTEIFTNHLINDQKFLIAAHTEMRSLVEAFLENEEVPAGGTIQWMFSLIPKLRAAIDGNFTKVNSLGRAKCWRGPLKFTEADLGFVYTAAIRGGWEPGVKAPKKAKAKTKTKAKAKAKATSEIEELKAAAKAIMERLAAL